MTRTERVGVGVAVVVGVGAVVAGLLGLRSDEVSFGWFAYAPLPETVHVPSRTSWRLGAALLVVGALVLGGAGGFALGRRRRTGP